MKKGLKKTLIAVITVAAMAATSVTVPEPEHVQAAAKKITITNVPYGTLTIKKGSTYQLKAKAGSKSNLKFVWQSSNKKKVSVSKNGKIKGLKNGTATITVSTKKKNYKKAKIKVTVGTKVSQVKVIKPAMVLCVGSTAKIKSQVLPKNASNQKVKYKTSNKKVATVNSQGVVNGITAGTAKVTILAADGSGKKTTVTVKVEKDVNEIKLVDDFYQSANADILKNTELDLKIGMWNQFTILEEQQEKKLDTLVEAVSNQSNPSDTAADNVSDLYRTAMDTDTRNEKDISTIQNYLEEIDKVSDINEYITLAGKLSKDGMDGAFNTFVYNDLKNPKNYQVYFNEIDTGLDNIHFSNIMFNTVKSAYTDYVEKLFRLSGENSQKASESTKAVLNFQKNISSVGLSILEQYNIDKLYNEYSLNRLKSLFTNCNIELYLNAAGYENVDSFIVLNPKQLERINKYLQNNNLDMLKEYAKLIILFRYAPYLTTEFYDAYETFNAKMNLEEKEDIEEFSKGMVEDVLEWEVSKLYVDRYVSPKTKENVTGMVDMILEQYHDEINNSTWLSSATKRNAIRKLDKMQKNISYPDDWSSYLQKSNLKGPDEGGVLSDNIQMLYKESKQNERSLLGTTGAADSWYESPLLVNAYYMPDYNSITIPIGITDGAMYDGNRSTAANYGSLGVIIGHEISHAFDESGSTYDENGEKNNWWTSADRKKYNELMEKLENYYENFEVLPGVFQDGKITLSENIADLAGTNCAVKLVEKNKDARKEFFESYANIWAGEMTDEVTRTYLTMDVHANQKVRVNAIVSLLDEFYETYDVKSTDAMYVAPKNRIKIW